LVLLWNTVADQPYASKLYTVDHISASADDEHLVLVLGVDLAAESWACCIAAAGATLLEKLHDELQQQGIQLGLCNPGEGQRW
jgi:hypothetical protein